MLISLENNNENTNNELTYSVSEAMCELLVGGGGGGRLFMCKERSD